MASRREARRLQHQELSRTQLLDAAEEVFGRKGYHETTLKEVAELAEFSVGSVYSFFESKDDLFNQIFLRHGEAFMPTLREICRPVGDPAAKLADLVAYSVEFFRAHPRFGRLFLRYSSSTVMTADRLVDALIAPNYDEAMGAQAELFSWGQAQKVFVEGDPVVLSRMLSGLITGYQVMDPEVMGDDAGTRATFTVEQLQELVARAFVIDG